MHRVLLGCIYPKNKALTSYDGDREGGVEFWFCRPTMNGCIVCGTWEALVHADEVDMDVALILCIPDHPSTRFCILLCIFSYDDALAAGREVRDELGNHQGARGFRLRQLHPGYCNIGDIRNGGAVHQNFRGEQFKR